MGVVRSSEKASPIWRSQFQEERTLEELVAVPCLVHQGHNRIARGGTFNFTEAFRDS